MVHIGYKSDCFLVFLRSISGTTIDIKLNIQQIVIKGTLPSLEIPKGTFFVVFFLFVFFPYFLH